MSLKTKQRVIVFVKGAFLWSQIVFYHSLSSVTVERLSCRLRIYLVVVYLKAMSVTCNSRTISELLIVKHVNGSNRDLIRVTITSFVGVTLENL
jgi:hypothetical protein